MSALDFVLAIAVSAVIAIALLAAAIGANYWYDEAGGQERLQILRKKLIHYKNCHHFPLVQNVHRWDGYRFIITKRRCTRCQHK